MDAFTVLDVIAFAYAGVALLALLFAAASGHGEG